MNGGGMRSAFWGGYQRDTGLSEATGEAEDCHRVPCAQCQPCELRGLAQRSSTESALFLVRTSKSESLALWRFWKPRNKFLFGLNKQRGSEHATSKYVTLSHW